MRPAAAGPARAKALPEAASPGPRTVSPAASGLGPGSGALRRGIATLPPSLRGTPVGELDAPEERQAEAVAGRVMAMQAGVPSEPPGDGSDPDTPADSGGRRSSAAGRPLSAAERGFFEPRFGRDLRAVRIHQGPEAHALTRALNARAVTHGRDIHVGPAPERSGAGPGLRLLAHELTHTLQPGASGVLRRMPREEFERTQGEVAQRTFALDEGYRTLVNALPEDFFRMTGQVRLLDELVSVAALLRRWRRGDERIASLRERMHPDRYDPVLLSDWSLEVFNSLNVLNATLFDCFERSPSDQRTVLPLVRPVARRLEAETVDLRRSAFYREGSQRAREEREEREAERRERDRVPEALRYLWRTYRSRRRYLESIDAPHLGARLTADGIARHLVRELELPSGEVRTVLVRIRDNDPAMYRTLLLHNTLLDALRRLGVEGLDGLELAYEGDYYDVRDAVVGGVMGEFEQDQTMGAIALDTTIGLIPILDQVADARDVAAHVYFLVRPEEDRSAGWVRWLSFGLTLVGIIPEVGTAIKGLSKLVMRGVGALRRWVSTRVAGRALNFLERVMPNFVDAVFELPGRIGRRWDDWTAHAAAFFRRLMTQLIESPLARRILGVSAAALRRLRSRGQRLIPEQLVRARDFLIELVGDVVDRARAAGRLVRERGQALAEGVVDIAGRGLRAIQTRIEAMRRIVDRIVARFSATRRLQMADAAITRATQRLDRLERRIFEAMAEGVDDIDEVVAAATRELDEVQAELTEALRHAGVEETADVGSAASRRAAGGTEEAAGAARRQAAEAERAGEAERAARRAEEPESESAAQRRLEEGFAVAEAEGIVQFHDAADTPAPILLLVLNALKLRYTWIRRFSATPRGVGHYRVVMHASTRTLKNDYTDLLAHPRYAALLESGDYDDELDRIDELIERDPREAARRVQSLRRRLEDAVEAGSPPSAPRGSASSPAQRREPRPPPAPEQAAPDPEAAAYGRRRPPAGLSELHVHRYLEQHFPTGEWEEQVTFLHGRRWQRRGRAPRHSTRPEAYNAALGVAAEVKNWDIAWSYDRLIQNIIDQQGGRVMSLPAGTRQWLFIDVRRQPLSGYTELLQSLRRDLGQSTLFERIHLLTDEGVL